MVSDLYQTVLKKLWKLASDKPQTCIKKCLQIYRRLVSKVDCIQALRLASLTLLGRLQKFAVDACFGLLGTRPCNLPQISLWSALVCFLIHSDLSLTVLEIRCHRTTVNLCLKKYSNFVVLGLLLAATVLEWSGFYEQNEMNTDY